MFRFCFISGLPTAIPPDLARTGKHLIALYEQLDAKSLTHAFVEKPEQREDLVTEAGAGRILRRVRGAVREKQNVRSRSACTRESRTIPFSMRTSAKKTRKRK